MTRRCRYNNMLELLHRHSSSCTCISLPLHTFVEKKIKSTLYIHCVQFHILSFIYLSICVSITNALPLSLEQKIL